MAQAIRDTLPLHEIYLDPNNYRFIDNKNYVYVPESRITDAQIQRRTANLIKGKNNEEIRDLISSFKKSDFLPVDQIQVTKIKDNVYKVIEGNRRIATLKHLREEYNKDNSIGNLSPSIFQNVPVVYYNASSEDTHYKVIMGLKHINGNKRWPLVNQAQLMQDMRDAGMSEEDIIDSLSVSKTRIRRSLRALALVKSYKTSDYGDQFQSDMFNVFDAIISSVPIKNWLGWDDDTMLATNTTNKERLFSWISTVEDFEYSDEEQNENIINKRDPIITTGRDVRELAKFIQDEKAIKFMEETHSISEAYLSSDLVGRDRFDTVLNALENNLNTALNLSAFAEDSHTQKLNNINKKLTGLIASQELTEIIIPQAVKPNYLFDFPSTKHLVKLHIKAYKGFNDINISKLSRINIFAGDNNSGKTSLLEAVRLLIGQNDANNFLNLLQLRGKFADGKMPPIWVVDSVKSNSKISGIFGVSEQENNVHIDITPQQNSSEVSNSANYLGSFHFLGEFMKRKSESLIHLFEAKEGYSISTSESLNRLCHFAYHSPFGGYRNNQIYNAHAQSVEKKYLPTVINFLRLAIDKNILDIKLIEKNGLKRFLVEHKEFTEAIDLNQFGDGLQNIFRVILLFVNAKNGIILIDELETAIHYSLLVNYSKLIQELAEEFNTQVFITSHSGECIDAFVDNDYNNESVSMYHLEKMNNGIVCKQISGKRYKELNELVGIDLRD